MYSNPSINTVNGSCMFASTEFPFSDQMYIRFPCWQINRFLSEVSVLLELYGKNNKIERALSIIMRTSPATRHSFQQPPKHRFGKSTHISMISNSITHLQSHTNSAIAGNSERSSMSLAAPSTDVSALSADIVASNGVWRVFECCDVSQCFKSVKCFTSGS